MYDFLSKMRCFSGAMLACCKGKSKKAKPKSVETVHRGSPRPGKDKFARCVKTARNASENQEVLGANSKKVISKVLFEKQTYVCPSELDGNLSLLPTVYVDVRDTNVCHSKGFLIPKIDIHLGHQIMFTQSCQNQATN